MILENQKANQAIQIKNSTTNELNALEVYNGVTNLLQVQGSGKVFSNLSTFDDVTSSNQIVPKIYSDQIASWKGILGSEKVLVGSQNAQYTTIQTAIDNIKNGTDAGKQIVVYPGTYTENLFVYDGIQIQGADQAQCKIEQPTSSLSHVVTLRNHYYEYNQPLSGQYSFRFPGTRTIVEEGLGKKHVTRIIPVSTTVAALEQTYFVLNDSAGSVAVWYDYLGTLTPPAAGTNRYIRVDISGATNSSLLSVQTRNALNADSEFEAVNEYFGNSLNNYGLIIRTVDEATYGNSLQGTLPTANYLLSNAQVGGQTSLQKTTQTIDFTGLTAADFDTSALSSPTVPAFIINTVNNVVYQYYFIYVGGGQDDPPLSPSVDQQVKITVNPLDTLDQIVENFVRATYSTRSVFVIHNSKLLPRIQIEGNSQIYNLTVTGDNYDFATAACPIVDIDAVGKQYKEWVHFQFVNIAGNAGNTAGIKGCGVNGVVEMCNVTLSQKGTSNGLNGAVIHIQNGNFTLRSIKFGEGNIVTGVRIDSGFCVADNILISTFNYNITNGIFINGGEFECGNAIVHASSGLIANGIYINTDTFNCVICDGHIHGVSDLTINPALVGGANANLIITSKMNIDKISAPANWFNNSRSILAISDKNSIEDYGFKFLGELHVGSIFYPGQLVGGEGDATTTFMKVFRFNSGIYTDITTQAQSPINSNFDVFNTLLAGNILYIGSTQYQFFGITVQVLTPITGNTGSPTQEISFFRIDTNNISTAAFDGQYFTIYDANGSVAVWFDVDNNGTPEPAHGAARSIKISTLTNNMSDSDAADAIATVLNGDSQFSAVSDGIEQVTITSATTGSRTNISVTATLDTEVTVGVTQQGSDFNVLTEFFDGTNWQIFRHMSSQTAYPYDQYSSRMLERVGREEIRFDFEKLSSHWVTTSINGASGYWIRFRIQQAITQIPNLEQIKLHTNRTQINQDGFQEFFGRGEKKRILSLQERMDYNATTPASQTLNLGTNFSITIPFATFTATADKGFSQKFEVPSYLDTSKKLTLRVKYAVLGTGTGNIEFLFKFLYVKQLTNYTSQEQQIQKKIDTISSNQENISRFVEFDFYLDTATPGDDVIVSISRNADVSNTFDTLNENLVIGDLQITAFFWA